MVLKRSLPTMSGINARYFARFSMQKKAFDRVHYSKLFGFLIKRKLLPTIIRVIANYYLGNFVPIGWRGVFSDYFLATNGVKQGGVLSPVLSYVYIDDMLLALFKVGVGCYVGNVFFGVLAYAADIVIIAPSVYAMRKLLNV
jgi:hypothetical protein